MLRRCFVFASAFKNLGSVGSGCEDAELSYFEEAIMVRVAEERVGFVAAVSA